MIKEALEWLLDLGDEPIEESNNGFEYWAKSQELVREPVRACVPFSTLTGLCDYLLDGRDKIDPEDLFALVTSPTRVDVRATFRGNELEHALVGSATKTSWDRIERYDYESFVVALQTRFVQTDNLRDLLKLVGSIKSGQERETSDDGVSQTVVVRSGAVLSKEVQLPNPLVLKPHRTFEEVDQPESPFVFRMHGDDNPRFSLYCSDNEKWAREAQANIAAFLKERLEEKGFGVFR